VSKREEEALKASFARAESPRTRKRRRGGEGSESERERRKGESASDRGGYEAVRRRRRKLARLFSTLSFDSTRARKEEEENALNSDFLYTSWL
jgi:hypothetical protein